MNKTLDWHDAGTPMWRSYVDWTNFVSRRVKTAMWLATIVISDRLCWVARALFNVDALPCCMDCRRRIKKTCSVIRTIFVCPTRRRPALRSSWSGSWPENSFAFLHANVVGSHVVNSKAISCGYDFHCWTVTLSEKLTITRSLPLLQLACD